MAFLQKQLDFLESIHQGDATFQELTDFRAQELGEVSHLDTIRKGAKLLMEYVDAGWVKQPASPTEALDTRKTISTNKDGSQSSKRDIVFESEDDLQNPEFLLLAHNYDPEKWEIITSTHSFWGSAEKQQCSSKILVRPKTDGGFNKKKLEEWFNALPSPKVKAKEYEFEEGSDNCLVLPIADLHYNLLATSFVAGNDYNKEVAKKNFFTIIDQTRKRVTDKKITQILLVLGNDMMNANGIAGTTFKGTQQDNEGHFFEAFLELSNILVEGIQMLTEVAPVQIVFVPSNHDKESSWHLNLVLSVYFRENENVKTDISPLPRKYVRFGSTMFMFTHDAKITEIPRMFLDETSEEGVQYYDAMLAHLHSESVVQSGNVTIRRLPTTSGNSAWTTEQGYNARKAHQSFIYNSELNLTDILYVTV